jgi:hypothetical protein
MRFPAAGHLASLLQRKTAYGTHPIFIFASGNRCGSTLLQRLLNSHQNILIWGEQQGCLRDILPASEAFVDWSFDKADERETYRYSGYDNFLPNLSPSPEQIKRATAKYIEMLFAEPAVRLGRHIWGFKEVRYPITIALLLQDYFPEARFLHLTRNIHDCVLSLKRWEAAGVWSRAWTLQSIENWVLINQGFLAYGRQLNALLSVRYEDMVAAEPQAFVAKLAAFLDVPATSLDPAVFHRKLNGTEPGTPIIPFTAEERALIATPEIERISRALQY